METNVDNKLLRNNPFFVIGIACLIAMVMFAVSFLIYYRSDTRRTIDQIQANNEQVLSTPPSKERTTELSGAYIDELEEEITDKITSHSDEVEFNPDELTDSALGL